MTAALLFATSRPWGTKALAIGIAGLLALGMVVPQPVHAQFGALTGITGVFNAVNQVANSILNFINNTMRPLLEGIQSASQHYRAF
jgi:hypothetical protein